MHSLLLKTILELQDIEHDFAWNKKSRAERVLQCLDSCNTLYQLYVSLLQSLSQVNGATKCLNKRLKVL
jgi:hypothetical protein